MQARIVHWHRRICLGALALMLTAPFLIAHHYNPIPAFYPEWTAAALSLAVLSWLLHAAREKPLEIPEIGLLPLGLMLIGLLQILFHPAAQTDRLLLLELYMIWAGLMTVLGRRLAQDLGLEPLFDIMATAILIGALLEALTGGIQLAGMARSPWIFPHLSGGLRGNLAQSNNFADYLWLGVVSALYLRGRNWLRNSSAAASLFILLPFAVLSGSRSVWFYASALVALTVLWTWRQPEARTLRYWSIGALLGSLAFQIIFSSQFLPLPSGFITSGGRLAVAGSYDPIRPMLWRIALDIFSEYPWLGAGFGQYTQQFHLHVLELMPRYLPGLPEHAHNILLNLLAEMGIAAGFLLIILGLRWAVALARGPHNTASWWAAAIILVLTVHANIEYPLWYAFFLGIACLVTGAASRTNHSLQLGRMAPYAIAAALALGSVILYILQHDYGLLEDTVNYRIAARSAAEHKQQVEANLTRLAREPLLRPYADLAAAHWMADNGDALAAKLETCERAQRFSPSHGIVFKCAHLLALAERDDEAKLALRRAVASYPERASMVLNQWKTLSTNDPAIARLLADFPPMIMTAP